MNKNDIDTETIRKAAEKSTRDSAALEGRVIPEDYVRPLNVEEYLKAIRGLN